MGPSSRRRRPAAPVDRTVPVHQARDDGRAASVDHLAPRRARAFIAGRPDPADPAGLGQQADTHLQPGTGHRPAQRHGTRCYAQRHCRPAAPHSPAGSHDRDPAEQAGPSQGVAPDPIEGTIRTGITALESLLGPGGEASFPYSADRTNRPRPGSVSLCQAFSRRTPHLTPMSCGWATRTVTRCPRTCALPRRAARPDFGHDPALIIFAGC